MQGNYFNSPHPSAKQRYDKTQLNRTERFSQVQEKTCCWRITRRLLAGSCGLVARRDSGSTRCPGKRSLGERLLRADVPAPCRQQQTPALQQLALLPLLLFKWNKKPTLEQAEKGGARV